MKSKAKQVDKWRKLTDLIEAYRDATLAESWKGSGDPADVEVLEVRLKLAELELETHIAIMRRDAE